MKQLKEHQLAAIFYLSLLCILTLLPGSHSKAATVYYDVTTFGATANDTKDDADAIQEALDMANAENITYVTFPDGTFYLEDTLIVHSNTVIQLSPNTVITRNVIFSDENMIRTGDYDYSSEKVGGYDLASNIVITGGTWDGGNIEKAAKGATSNLIYLGHASNVTITGTTVRNCYGAHAIELAGVKDSVISNCTITGFRYAPNNFTAEAIQLDTCYESDDEEWTPGYMLDGTECRNITIQNNTIIDYPRGIGAHHSLSGHEISDVVICNNTMQRSSAATQYKCSSCVFLIGVKNFTISNNTFNYYDYGTWVKQSTNVQVTGNRFMYNNVRSMIIEGCDANNGTHSFVVTKDDVGKKKFVFTCGNIQKGKVKTKGKTYKFTRTKKKVKLTLKKKIKANQVVKFYGTDNYGNVFYRKYKVPKPAKKK